MSRQTLTQPQTVTGIDLTDVDLFRRGHHTAAFAKLRAERPIRLFEQLMVSGPRFRRAEDVRRPRWNFLLGVTRPPVEVIR